MKKILVDGMPRTIGGIGVLILNLAECSRECGDSDSFQFEFIIAGTSGYLTTLREKGYKYHIAPPIHDLVTYNSFYQSFLQRTIMITYGLTIRAK